jgi:hypothetical protein|eukprot:COSAG01_NODE_1965_length_8779_cov_5.132604_9_plen_112_part_00
MRALATLSLRAVRLGPRSMGQLAPALPPNLTALDLSENVLGVAGKCALAPQLPLCGLQRLVLDLGQLAARGEGSPTTLESASEALDFGGLRKAWAGRPLVRRPLRPFWRPF